jgi:hypothetical protein
MKISNLKRIEMGDIDVSNSVRYSAILNGNTLIQYETDGFFYKHLTIQEWEDYAKELVLKHFDDYLKSKQHSLISKMETT